MKRIFLIVLDSLGIGAAPDAADFGDAGAHTLRSVSGKAARNLFIMSISSRRSISFSTFTYVIVKMTENEIIIRQSVLTILRSNILLRSCVNIESAFLICCIADSRQHELYLL